MALAALGWMLAAPASAAIIAVPAGSEVPVTLTGSVSSSTARVGDVFHFTTSAEMQAGSVTVPAGTPGHGVVTAASAAAKHPGSLGVTPVSLDLPDGRVVPVEISPKTREIKGSATTQSQKLRVLPIPLPFPLGIGTIGFGSVGQSSDVTLRPGTEFRVVTTGATELPFLPTPPPPLPSPTPSPSLAP